MKNFSEYLADDLFMGSGEIMDRYCMFYDVIRNNKNKFLQLATPESDFSHFLKLNHTKVKYLPIHVQQYKWTKNSLLYAIQKSWHSPKQARHILKHCYLHLYVSLLSLGFQ